MKDSSMSAFRQWLDTWVPSPRVACLLLLWLTGAIVILVAADSPATVADKIALELAEGKAPSWKMDTVLGIFWGAAANVAIAAVLLCTMRWWARWDSSSDVSEAGKRLLTGGMSSRLFFTVMVLMVVLAGALRWRLAHGSLWWDEMWNLKMATVGEFRTGSRHPDELRFYPTDFARCAWYYQKPTNHVPTALASKVCHQIWAQVTGAEEGVFDEFVIRFPVFLSVLGSVVLIGVCTRRWLGAGAGILAAFLLAVHPWFIRYGIDARAYGPVVFFSLVALSSLYRAILTDRCRYWALFGFAQFMLMWSNLHSIWFCSATTLAAAILIWLRSDEKLRLRKIGSLVVANTLAAGAFLQVFLPNLIQLYRWSSIVSDGSMMSGDLVRSLLSQLLFGMEPEWAAQSPEASGLVSWASLTGGKLWVMWLALLAASSVVVTGILSLWRKDRAAAALVLAFFAGAAVFAFSAWALDIYFYTRFVISLLPAVVIALSAGLWQLSGWLSGKCLPLQQGVIATVSAAVFVAVCLPQIRLLQQRSYAPMREVAGFLKQQDKDTNGGVMVFGYGLGSRILRVYHPQLEFVIGPPGDESLRNTLEKAVDQGKPLYVFYGYPIFNRMVMPEGFELLDDKTLFEEVAAFGGIEPEFYFRVLRAK